MMAKPGTCKACALDHDPAWPHNQQSLFYQMRFHGAHGRWPTWADAVAHCEPDLHKEWKDELTRRKHWSEPPEGVAPIAERGEDIPDGPIPMPNLTPIVVTIDHHEDHPEGDLP